MTLDYIVVSLHSQKKLCLSTIHKYDWVQLGAALKHPDNGKVFDLSEDVSKETGVEDAYLKIYAKYWIR